MTNEEDNVRNCYCAIKATPKQSCEDEDIAKAFQLGLAFGFVEKRGEAEWIDDKCSVCGKGIEDLIASPEWYRNEEPNFCPFCGKKFKERSSMADQIARYKELKPCVNIPFLLHKETGCPLYECVEAYEKAYEYLRSKAKMIG